MMKIVLIEDEKPAARRLSRMIHDLGYDEVHAFGGRSGKLFG